MKHFKDPSSGDVYAYEADGSQDAAGAVGVATFRIANLSRTVPDLGGGTGYPYWFSAVIPNGVTYSISGAISLPAWWELR